MNAYEAFELDDDLVDQGIWVEIVTPSGEKVGKVRVRPEDATVNSHWRRASMQMGLRIEAWITENNPPIDAKTGHPVLPEDVDRRFVAQAYAEGIVTDVEMDDRDNNAVDGSDIEVVTQLLYDLPKLMQIVRRHAQRWTNYRRHFEEEAVKN